MLERVPVDREVHLCLDGLSHVDHAALELMVTWERAQRRSGRAGVVDLSAVGAPARQMETVR